MLAQVTAALEISQEVERFGAYAGLASILGLAILSLLHFGQARELKRLREWAGRAPERAAELQERAAAYEQQVAAAQAAARTAPPAGGPVRRPGAPLPPRVGPAVPVAAGQETQAFDAGGDVRVLGPVREDGTGPQPAVELPPPDGAPEAAPAPGTSLAPAAAATTGAVAPAAVAAGAGRPATAAAGTAPAPGTPAVTGPADGAPGDGPARPGAPAGIVAAGAAPAASASAAPAPAPPAGGPPSFGPSGPSTNGGGPTGGGPRPGGGPGFPPGERPAGPVRVSAAGAVPPPRTAAGAVRARPGADGPATAGPRGRGRLLAYVGGAVAAAAAAAVLAVTLLGGEDDPAPSGTTVPAEQANRLEDPASTGAAREPALDRSQFSIRVLNGTTTAGVARTVNDRLEERDYTAAAQPTNAALNNVPTTTVAYTEGNRRAANDVARILGVERANVVQADEGTRVQGGGADVIVTVGADKASG